jgi:Flp pilus assembly protein TadD
VHARDARDKARLHLALGALLARTGHPGEARHHLRTAVRLDPNLATEVQAELDRVPWRR